jgi:hypothetical protein|nr:MAG TPA: hypothetical protein [Caudoviricetes sp.]
MKKVSESDTEGHKKFNYSFKKVVDKSNSGA